MTGASRLTERTWAPRPGGLDPGLAVGRQQTTGNRQQATGHRRTCSCVRSITPYAYCLRCLRPVASRGRVPRYARRCRGAVVVSLAGLANLTGGCRLSRRAGEHARARSVQASVPRPSSLVPRPSKRPAYRYRPPRLHMQHAAAVARLIPTCSAARRPSCVARVLFLQCSARSSAASAAVASPTLSRARWCEAPKLLSS